MRLPKLVLAVLASFGLACATTGWAPPKDDLWVDTAPGLFGWVMADTKKGNDWTRQVTITVMLIGPDQLRGSSCRIVVNDKLYEFPPNASHTWVLRAPFAEGKHEVVVYVGGKLRRRLIRVWHFRMEGEI